jgi:intracellular sulfur oxidation DsrE/DsrF family protein
MMKNSILSLAAGSLLLLSSAISLHAEDAAAAQPLKIDIPVDLKEAKVVFNMDHPAFAGDASIGLTYMKLMTQNFDRSKTKWTIKSVFHGAMGYMLLNDAAYNKVRKSDKGNPYKEAIADLQKTGIELEECGQTARSNNWTNADLLPNIKVNAGANLRITQLVQEGYVQLQP